MILPVLDPNSVDNGGILKDGWSTVDAVKNGCLAGINAPGFGDGGGSDGSGDGASAVPVGPASLAWTAASVGSGWPGRRCRRGQPLPTGGYGLAGTPGAGRNPVSWKYVR